MRGPVSESDLVWLKYTVYDREWKGINLGKNLVQIMEGLQFQAEEFDFNSSAIRQRQEPHGSSMKAEHRLKVKFPLLSHLLVKPPFPQQCNRNNKVMKIKQNNV